jgi:malonate transporter and related proteins
VSAAIISLIPVFGLIALGSLVGRMKLLSDEGWRGVEGLNYWILFPALLFKSVASAELSGSENGRLALATLVAALVMSAMLLAARRCTRLSGPAYSSLFQTALRWNGYVGLAVVASVLGAEALAFAAVVLAVMVPANNVLSVYVLSRFAGTTPAPLAQALGNVVRNPLIVATAAGATLKLTGVRLPGPLIEGLNLLGQATLATGLLCVGAAVDLKGLKASMPVQLTGAAIKLIAAPAVMCLASLALGVPALPLAVGVICLAAPLTTSAYILARQLGGDAALAANLVSVTTVLSLATYPVVIFLVI